MAARMRSASGVGGEFDADDRATAEVDVQRQMMPEKDGKQARYAEDEREAEEIPLLPEPVDFWIMKQFHEIPPIKRSLEVSQLKSRSARRAVCG